MFAFWTKMVKLKILGTNKKSEEIICFYLIFGAFRQYMQHTLLNFQKFFLFPKMAAILNVRILDTNGKT